MHKYIVQTLGGELLEDDPARNGDMELFGDDVLFILRFDDGCMEQGVLT